MLIKDMQIIFTDPYKYFLTSPVHLSSQLITCAAGIIKLIMFLLDNTLRPLAALWLQ